MIPLRDKISSSSFPAVNTAIIALNVVVFLYEISLRSDVDALIGDFGLVPAAVFSSDGELSARIYPFFTSMFLHGGWLHLLGNVLFLYIFGDNVEDRMGHAKYLGFYLLSGLGAAAAQIASNVDSIIPMVGASGAISGVLGAYILFFPKSRILTLVPIFFFIQLVEIPALVFLFIWFGMQFLGGLASLAESDNAGGVAFWAHIGGFVAGLMLAKFFEKKGFIRAGRLGKHYG
ncbi:MAG: rhomboid family intramembrane serine protease [Deltaproteobacteria bacterium]